MTWAPSSTPWAIRGRSRAGWSRASASPSPRRSAPRTGASAPSAWETSSSPRWPTSRPSPPCSWRTRRDRAHSRPRRSARAASARWPPPSPTPWPTPAAFASWNYPSRPRGSTSAFRRSQRDPAHRERDAARGGGARPPHAARLPALRPRAHGIQGRLRRRRLRRVHRFARRQDDQLLHRAGRVRGRPRDHHRRGAGRGRAPASRPAGVHRPRRLSVRHLHAGPGGGGQGAPRLEPRPQRDGHQGVDAGQPLPLHGLLQDRRIDPGRRPGEATVSAFHYADPRGLDEALAILAEHGDEARVVAGGTALVTMLRQRLLRPACLVSLREVKGLDRIESANGAIRLGALVTHRDAELSPLLRERLPMLAETFRRVGTIRIRHMATVGGALAHADPNQDPPVTLLALGARVEIRRPRDGASCPSAISSGATTRPRSSRARS